MANLETLLLYQQVDIQLRKINEEIENHEYAKKLDKARSEFNSAKAMVNESEKAAESLINFYNNSLTYFEENGKKFASMEQRLLELDEENIDERKEIIDQLEVLRDKMAELEKKLAERRQKSETVIHAYIDAQERGKKFREVYNSMKVKLDSFKAEKQPRINELNEQLNRMKSSIDPQLFTQYKALTQEGKYPALVEASTSDGGRNYSCNGCGLSLSQKAKSELNEKAVYRCDNCRRIIFRR